MTERKQRVPFRDFSTLSAEDRELGGRAQVNGKVVNIFRVLMQHPKLACLVEVRQLHPLRSADSGAS